MFSERFSHLYRGFAIFILSCIAVSCGSGDGPDGVAAVPCPASGIVSFDADSYAANASSASVALSDACIGLQTVVVLVDNGADTIALAVTVDADGKGSAPVFFGVTNDATDTIVISEGDLLTLTYIDANGAAQTDTASITALPSVSTLGVYSETSINPVIAVAGIINAADFGGKSTVTDEVTAAVIAPLEGVNSLRAVFDADEPLTGSDFNGFVFDFGPPLVNGTFEADDASAGNVAGATGWTTFESVFTNNTAGPSFGPVSHDAGGTQSLTMFGPFVFDGASGAFQAVDSVVAGSTYTATAHVMNWAPDALAANNLGIFQLTFWDAPGGQNGGGTRLGVTELIVDSTDDGSNIFLPAEDGAEISDWRELTITEIAPAGAVSAEIFLLHIQLNTPAVGGSIFWDDISFVKGVTAAAEAGADVSSFEVLRFALNATAAGALADLEVKLEDTAAGSASVFLSDYTPNPGAVAGWDLYEIPLGDFSATVDKTRIISLGYFNVSSTPTGATAVAPTLFDATLYFDDIHFATGPAGGAIPLTGVLLDSAVEGVSYQTATQSGITNALGEFRYVAGETVTFSVGDIVLGSAPGASIITAVELTGGADPVSQAATNVLVLLQSIDEDGNHDNGITISAATQAAALGQTLDFSLSSVDFATAVTQIVSVIAPGNSVVPEAEALDNFYQTYIEQGGSDTFSWSFPPQLFPPFPGVASIPVDFEDAGGPYFFTDFEGGVATVIDNPQNNAGNSSARVAQMQKFAGQDFGGSTLTLGTIDFSGGSVFTMKVWASREVPVTLKLEGLDNAARVASHSGSGTWEELAFDFTGFTGAGVRELTFIFDNGIPGDAAGDAASWTFLFDDIDVVASAPVIYELVWSDEFNEGTAPSAENWTMETGYGDNGWGNNEWQLYTTSPDNVRVEGGNLVITADCPTAPVCGVRDDSITSARIKTEGSFSFKFGKVEARIKPPVGKAAWPAFWMLGANFADVGWPNSGEIDVMEMHNAFSDDRTTHFTMHWCNDLISSNPCLFNPGWTFVSESLGFPSSLGDDFHVFSAEWDANGITGKIDGIPYFFLAINPGTMDEFLKEFFMLLNVAMGGTLGSNSQPPNGTETWPQIMLVDYVRVYQQVGGDGTFTIGSAPLAPLGVYSETNIDPLLAYSEIINVADFGGKNTVVEENSLDVALDGVNSLKADFISSGTGGNFNGFVFNFGTAGGGGSNLLINGGFEAPDAALGDAGCPQSWGCFNANFTASNNFQPGGSFLSPAAHSGSQVLKQFGVDAGAFQDAAANPGDTVQASVYAMNWNGDNFNNIFLLQIFALDVNGNNLSGGFNPLTQVAAGSDAIAGGSFDYVLSGTDGGNDFDWTEMSVSALMPAGTASVRVQLIHIPEATTADGGAIFLDDASLSIGGPVSATPGGDVSAYETLKFAINTSAASGLRDLEVKIEDDNAIAASVFLSAYTPTVVQGQIGSWDVYEIALIDFVGLDLSKIIFMGFYNASSTVTGSTAVAPMLLDGTLYFDDIHFKVGLPVSGGGGGSNLLTNGGFESPDAALGDAGCPQSWGCFNANFTTSNLFLPGGSFVNPTAHGGSQMLKQFGGDGGALQSVAVNAGDTVNASVHAMSWSGDVFNNLALLQIAYLDAGNNAIAVSEVFADSVGNQAYLLTPQDGGEISDWTLMEVSGVAPAGTVAAQILLLHILTDGTPAGGSIFWDDASLSTVSP